MGKISKSEWGRLAESPTSQPFNCMFCTQAFAFFGRGFSRPSAAGDKTKTKIQDKNKGLLTV